MEALEVHASSVASRQLAIGSGKIPMALFVLSVNHTSDAEKKSSPQLRSENGIHLCTDKICFQHLMANTNTNVHSSSLKK